jgi:hypothetical protein
MSEYRNVAEPLAAATRPENKCQHGVHSPNRSLIRNRYCSICRSAMSELFAVPTAVSKKAVKAEKKRQQVVEVKLPEPDDPRPEYSGEELYVEE